MNKKFYRLIAAAIVSCLGVSCTTAYDSYGRPVQVVDPTTAVVGAAAVGLLAYGLANSKDNSHRRSHYRNDRSDRYYRPSYRSRSYGYGGYDRCYY